MEAYHRECEEKLESPGDSLGFRKRALEGPYMAIPWHTQPRGSTR